MAGTVSPETVKLAPVFGKRIKMARFTSAYKSSRIFRHQLVRNKALYLCNRQLLFQYFLRHFSNYHDHFLLRNYWDSQPLADSL